MKIDRPYNETVERWTSYWRSRWSSFDYNFGWSDYVFLFDGWVAKCAMAVPIIGYLILFNDTISQHLSFNKLASEDVLGFGLSSAARLKFIYFGLIFCIPPPSTAFQHRFISQSLMRLVAL